MTKNSRRFLCLALACALLAALLPAAFSGLSAGAESSAYGKTTADMVNVRQGASMSAKLYCRIAINTICPVLGTKEAEGYVWYEVTVRDPDSAFIREYDAYIRGDCFRMLTDEEEAAYLGTTVTAAPVVTAAPDGSGSTPTQEPVSTDTAAPAGTVGYVTAGGVNFRQEPGGYSMMTLNRGTEVNVLTIPSVISSNTWYKVEYNGTTGYIMSTFLNLNGTYPVVTATPTVTQSPTATPMPNPDIRGYVMTTKGSVNIRASIGGTSITTVGKYVTMPYLLDPIKRGNYTWYFVQAGTNIRGYIRGDCVKVVAAPTTAPVTATPTAAPTSSGETTPVPEYTPVPVVTASPTPAITEPTGWVKTTIDYVNVRKGIWGQLITVVKKAGTVFPYYGEPRVSNNVKWYYIYSAEFSTGYGWIHGGYVKETDQQGTVVTPTPKPTATATPTPTPTPAPTATATAAVTSTSSPDVTPTVNPNPTENPGTVTEASYSTLKTGSSGLAVQNLVQELINQGYYTGSLTSKYNSAVENAVRAFQKAKGLAVDGVAGSNTQHALFNTVPVGTADKTNLSITLYPAEKIDWNTGGIQELWPRGANVKVYDVYTGIVWWAHRWAGGLHVDAEPLTAADTARLCQIYGVKSASEITSRTHWQRRPCLVTIGTRTFACSLYGVPHNPDGDTISDNNFVGQLCIHFTNSKIHGTKIVDSLHMEAIEYAWLNAPNGHK